MATPGALRMDDTELDKFNYARALLNLGIYMLL